MSCNCKTELESKLTDSFKAKEPNASAHKVELMGYGLVVTDTSLVSKAFMEYETFALMPLKKGGSKPKKTTGNMFFSYCPFCGVEA